MLINRCQNHGALTGRFILLLGAARSGTTWLANILNSSPRTWYSHEPISKLDDSDLQEAIEQIKHGEMLSPEERSRLLWHWSRAYHALARPPFFAKDFLRIPPTVRWTAWLAVRGSGHGFHAYRSSFSPAKNAHFDLVVKQGFSAYTQHFVESMKPDSIITILRHPCAVISSLRRGRKHGLMESDTRGAWLSHHAAAAADFGYTRDQVERMPNAKFESPCWLVESSNYASVAKEHLQGHIVIYREICSDPVGTTERLFQAMGWEITSQTRKFLAETTGNTPPRWLAKFSAGNPYFSVYRPRCDSIHAWTRELSRNEQDEIMGVARPLLQQYWTDPSPVAI